MKQQKKKVPVLIVVLLWLLALAAVGGTGAYALWNRALSPRDSDGPGTSYRLKVQSGMSVQEVARTLEEAGIIRSAAAFYVAVRFQLFSPGVPFTLKVGTYTVKSTMSLEEIYVLVQTGTPEYVTVSIPEGLTLSKTAAILEASGLCRAEDFKAAARDSQLLEAYGIPADSLEGYLFPDTYYFNEDADAAAIVRQLVDTFFAKLSDAGIGTGLAPEALHHIVILASIVEREYRAAPEAPLIAGVFENRLAAGMALGSCATIEYIITEELGKPHPTHIYYADLEIDSPYNTYRNTGLPPGPIANPGLVALQAAATPAQTENLYFVLTDPEAGTHTFSKTLQAHESAKNQVYTTKGSR